MVALNRKQIAPYLLGMDISVKQAMQRLDENEEKTIFVLDPQKRLAGALTDGDIRRWILGEGNLTDPVHKVCNRRPSSARMPYDLDEIRRMMTVQEIACVPVLDADGKIVDLLFWKDVFQDDSRPAKKQLDVSAVIMAGGRGVRLDPFTRILPKPLIPIGDKPIIEIIIDKFREHGLREFYVSVNYKSNMIKAYFDDANPDYRVHYVHEDQPLGTAGSLKLLEGRLKGSFFVSNCDILIEGDYAEILDHHDAKQNDITLVASVKNYHIPYGVCDIENGGTLSRIREKPELDFLVNTGMYVLKAGTLDLIPRNRMFHITDLIQAVKKEGGHVGVFPVSDKSWIDVGEWDEFRKAVKIFSDDMK